LLNEELTRYSDHVCDLGVNLPRPQKPVGFDITITNIADKLRNSAIASEFRRADEACMGCHGETTMATTRPPRDEEQPADPNREPEEPRFVRDAERLRALLNDRRRWRSPQTRRRR